MLEPEFAMNIAKTACDLGGEEEEKRDKAVVTTKVLQCTTVLTKHKFKDDKLYKNIKMATAAH